MAREAATDLLAAADAATTRERFGVYFDKSSETKKKLHTFHHNISSSCNFSGFVSHKRCISPPRIRMYSPVRCREIAKEGSAEGVAKNIEK